MADEKPVEQKPIRNISDAARAYATANKIDLARVKGSGAGGRIVKEDIDKAIAAKAKAAK